MDISQKKFLVYDFDETITTLNIDWSGWRQGQYRIFKKHDPELEYDVRQQSFSFQNKLSRKYGERVVKDLHAFSREYEGSHYFGHFPNQKLVKFIKQVFETGEQKQYVWTSNNSYTVLPVIQELGLENVFETVVARDTVTFMKPDPEGFSHIFVEGSDLTEYVMIGDNPASDAGAAQAAGIDFIHVNDFLKMI